MLRRRKCRTGFTLVELLIVITIIGILAGMMTLSAGTATDKAQATRIVNNMRVLKTAAIMYYADNGSWPVSSNETNGDPADVVLSGYLDRSNFANDNIGGTYTVILLKAPKPPHNSFNGSVYIKYTNANMSAGLKQQLAAMAPKANLWNSTAFVSGNYNSSNTNYYYQYYNGANTATGSQSSTIHMPVYITTTN